MIGDAALHCGRNSQALMHAAQVVVGELRGEGAFQVVPALAETVRGVAQGEALGSVEPRHPETTELRSLPPPALSHAAHYLHHQQTLERMGEGVARRGRGRGIFDRVLERGSLVRLNGPSGQTRHLKLEDPWQGVQNGLGFPKPT